MAIEKAVGMLSEEHRMVVALVLVDGMPYKEASEVLEIPMGTLTSRLVRARGALQEILSDQKRTAT
jgi:RNA polymerase sigma-70 factor (ECF subfamily)